MELTDALRIPLAPSAVREALQDIALLRASLENCEAFTRLHLLLYTLLMIATTLLPFASGMAGYFYLGATLVLDAVFLTLAIAIWRSYSHALARRTFAYSIFFLAMLFAALMVDHYLPLLAG